MTYSPAEIVAKKSKGQSAPRTKTNTRGMLKVKGLDINDNQDEFGADRNFELRPSISPSKEKKKKCCSS